MVYGSKHSAPMVLVGSIADIVHEYVELFFRSETLQVLILEQAATSREVQSFCTNHNSCCCGWYRNFALLVILAVENLCNSTHVPVNMRIQNHSCFLQMCSSTGVMKTRVHVR